MRELVLLAGVGDKGSSVTTANNDSSTSLSSLDGGVEKRVGALGELLKLEDTGGAVPEDGLGVGDGLGKDLVGLGSTVEAHPSVGDTVLVRDSLGLGVGGKLVTCNVVDGEDELDVLLLGLLHEVADNLGSVLIKEGRANVDVLKSLLEGESHTTADDELVDLVKHGLDELDLVLDLGTAEDGKEGTLGVLQDLAKVLELLGHEESRGALLEVDTDHGRVSAVSGSEAAVSVCTETNHSRIVDVDIAELGKALAELLDVVLLGLGLLAVYNALALLLDVEAEVLKEEDLSVLALVDSLGDVVTNAVGEELDVLAKKLLKLLGDRLEGELFLLCAIGAAEVRHENDRLGTCASDLRPKPVYDLPLSMAYLMVGRAAWIRAGLVISPVFLS